MFYTWDFAEKIASSDREKEEAVDLIMELVQLDEKSREDGLLSLEEEIPSMSHPLLKKGIQLVVDGTEPEIVRRVLERYILMGNYRGVELLKRCIILEGTMSIQAGDNPEALREQLQAFLGLEYDAPFLDMVKNLVKQRIEKFLNQEVRNERTALLEDVIPQLSDGQIQKILRELDMDVAVRMCAGAGGGVIGKLLANLNERSAYLFSQDLHLAASLEDEEIRKAQQLFLSIKDKVLSGS